MNDAALERSLSFLTSWLRYRFERGAMPGFAVGIAYRGEVVFNQAYGYANLEDKTALTTKHTFRIASHSKTFTATSLMQLAEQGRLRIDDNVVDYLPWLGDHKDRRWRTVTVRQLMSHGAGVIRDGVDAEFWQVERAFPKAAEFRRAVLDTDLIVDSNERLKYSNVGYTVLGLLIESVSGLAYNQYVVDNIVKPLGLRDVGPEYAPTMAANAVTGYSRRDIDNTRMPIAPIVTHAMSAATGFYATAHDLCHYFSAHLVGSGRLLTDQSKREMQRLQFRAKQRPYASYDDYGLGLEVCDLNGRRMIGHGGGFPGQITKTIVDPTSGLVVVALTNCVDGEAPLIARGVYNVIDYYQGNSAGAGKAKFGDVDGRFMNLWLTRELVTTGTKTVVINPDLWEPFNDVEELARVDETSFKVLDSSSYGVEGELVRVVLTKGNVAGITYSGSTIWPEKVWLKRQRRRKVIDIK